MSDPTADPRLRAALAIAFIAGLFCVLILATVVFHHATAVNNDPWKSPQLLALKAQLQSAPRDEQLKTQIRELDLKYRQRFFHRLATDRTAGWLLLGGMAVFLVAAKQVARARKPLPSPTLHPDASAQTKRQAASARRAVSMAGLGLCGAFAVVAFRTPTLLPSTSLGLQKPSTASATNPVSDLPPLAEFQKNWPRFRGPDGSGFTKDGNLPLSWDGKTGSGILWKSPIPAPGFNSPLVWNDRVFISGGTAEKREVFCYAAADGKLLWQRAIDNVPGSPAKAPEISDSTGYAAPTMAADGRRVYAIFATGDLAAVAFDGTLAWSKHLGVPKNQYGHATSLGIWQGKVLVQLDQGESEPGNSKLIAFDGASGKVVWEKSRPVASSWASPIVIEAAGKTQIITLGVPWVTAYSMTDGAELWKAALLEGEIAPSPIYAGGLVCVICPSSKMIAIRPDGSGDVTKTHVAWTSEENLPDVTTPATNGNRIFYVTSSGQVTCLDAKTGKKAWDHDVAMEVQSSPVIAGERVYIMGTSGETLVIDAAGPEYKEIGKGSIGDKFYASAAFAGGRIYLRGNGFLYCIGVKESAGVQPQSGGAPHALQDAGARNEGSSAARSALECGGPPPPWEGTPTSVAPPISPRPPLMRSFQNSPDGTRVERTCNGNSIAGGDSRLQLQSIEHTVGAIELRRQLRSLLLPSEEFGDERRNESNENRERGQTGRGASDHA
ncbi:MAG: PQQ-binding-like beta-propeller repeat protein [Verrucomicrobiota bacterium]